VVSQYVQDEIKLVPDLWTFTIGCKLEQSSFVNIDYEPSARLLWTPDKKRSIWGVVSRAVHPPTRINEDVFNTNGATAPASFSRAFGNTGLLSEALYAFELGYREQVSDRFSFDVATFYNYYNELFGGRAGTIFSEPTPAPAHNVRPVVYDNLYNAHSYGVELGTNWSVSDRWRLYTQYTYFYSLFSSPSFTATGSGGTPANQVYMMSSWDLRKNLDFDLMARYVDRLPGYNVPSYISMDLRLAWRPRKHLELAVVGQNLLQTYHREYGFYNFLNAVNNAEATEIPRSVYGTVTCRY
jgi:iron complex outermembrane receptor protein